MERLPPPEQGDLSLKKLISVLARVEAPSPSMPMMTKQTSPIRPSLYGRGGSSSLNLRG